MTNHILPLNHRLMKIRIFMQGLLLTLVMSGCVVYQTPTVDIPLISKKNDLRIDAGVSFIPSVHATASYGLTDKVAVQGFASINTEKNRYFQAAAGLYKNKANSRVTELYGGIGYGHGRAYQDAIHGNLYGNYQVYFAQLNHGKIASEASGYEVGFGIKTGYLHSNLTDENYYENRIPLQGPYKVYHDESLLFEPGGFFRMGRNKLKFSIKLGCSLIYKFTNTDKNLPYTRGNMGFGLNYRF